MHPHINIRQSFNLALFTETEAVLSEKEALISSAKWTNEDNIQLPSLVEVVANRLSIDVKSQPEIDAVIRGYVRTHPDWYVARGAKGGAMPFAVYQKKANAKVALEDAKKAVLEQINLKNKNIKMAAKVAIAEPQVAEPIQVSNVSDQSDVQFTDLVEDDLTL